MQTLKSVLGRFMQLLPFLTTPNSYRRFRFELFYPYPDILEDRGTEHGPAGPGGPHTAERPGGGRHPWRTHRMWKRAARENRPVEPTGPHLRPYLTWLELHKSRSHRGEPFC